MFLTRGILRFATRASAGHARRTAGWTFQQSLRLSMRPGVRTLTRKPNVVYVGNLSDKVDHEQLFNVFKKVAWVLRETDKGNNIRCSTES